MQKKIQFITTGLGHGGAEAMLYKLLVNIDRSKFIPEIISLMDYGVFGPKMADIDVPVKLLNLGRGIPNPLKIFQLAKYIRKFKPDIIQTWMYHADFLGSIAGRLTGKVPIIWNIRNSDLESGSSRQRTIIIVKACAKLSKKIPSKIICCAEKAREIHEKIGYDSNKTVVIPNGFDLDNFKPDLTAKETVRRELNLPKDSIVIGLVARFDPQKDHKNFILAAKTLANKNKNVKFVLCGEGVTRQNVELVNWIKEVDLTESFYLLGARFDIPRITASFDISCLSSSYGEAFPNVIGEAMACGVPCCVTDVGDSSLIVGNTGKVVPKKNYEALAGGLSELIDLGLSGRDILGKMARARVVEKFSLKKIVNMYEELYQNVSLV